MSGFSSQGVGDWAKPEVVRTAIAAAIKMVLVENRFISLHAPSDRPAELAAVDSEQITNAAPTSTQGISRRAVVRHCDFLPRASRLSSSPIQSSGVDLTFATLQATDSQCECKIQNSTRNIYLLVVLLILTFAKVPTKPGCEC